jgi:hypothetical protein
LRRIGRLAADALNGRASRAGGETQAQGDRLGTGASGALEAFRWLLVVALAVTVVVLIRMAVWEFSVADQSLSYYVIGLAISLVPACVYAAAVVLALVRRGGRVTWSVLLGCGLALSAVCLFYLVTTGFGELMAAAPCLVALSLLQLLTWPRPGAAQVR